MLDTTQIADNISFILVFLSGVISFLSPCVIPIIPLYLGYLAGNTSIQNEDGSIGYNQKKVLINTLFFVLGISVAFFILGMAFTAVGQFIGEYKGIISRISGIVVILFGLIQIGFLNFKFLSRDRRLGIKFNKGKMNPIMAFVMGFTFSFAWTPCVGPMLSSVLILASSAKTATLGNILVLVYTLGFVIPFILVGLFTTKILNIFKKNTNIIKYATKIGGIILISMGIMMYTGWMNSITGYLNQLPSITNEISQEEKEETSPKTDKEVDKDVIEENNSEAKADDENVDLVSAIDFTLMDQHGNSHTLSQYKGKTVFLNFWATGCPPCKEEIPRVEEIYKEYGENSGDILIITVVNPGGFLESDEDYIKKFIKDNAITFPVLFDTESKAFQAYYINSIPTTFMVNKDGNILGYVAGAMTKDVMKNIIKQTIESAK